ncbi:uncharacterized protein LOC100302487 isoform X1 [Acyrthosiphon pisum]|uniref:Uncharacterized protein n=1 Tax=Acyrthosiphon pisum TaxID=7029 RepID=A0A8R2FCG2_ACYPI|nr:uncharacterized protein LOC100302487 isoform X1 [Acyrthosiphon pisum]|eukprot:XP_008188233.1 PREDICTED: uncharacterized protein LOC100302487 isoform X3 [Acyrthosiphon pisum]
MVKYINYILSIFLVLIFIGCIYADVEECLGQMNSVNLTVLRDGNPQNENDSNIMNIVREWKSNGKPTRIEKLPYVKDYIDIIHKEGKVIIRPVQFCLNVKQ